MARNNAQSGSSKEQAGDAQRDTAVAAMNFEAAMEQLETIIDRIEAGEVGLEQSLTEYEQGMKLVAHCRAILERAETRIKQLTPDDEGRLQAKGDAETEPESDDEEADDEAPF
jgi:exodeoxyribonuclease VII small subunit